MVTKRKNASIPAQRAWALMTKKQRDELRKRYKQDPDRDGVPTGFDCRPYNKKKQESFLPSDRPYVSSHNAVTAGKFIGHGMSGDVYKVNKNMVVKVQRDGAHDSLNSEIEFIKDNRTSRAPLIIPTKLVKTRVDGKVKTGLLRPSLTPISDPTGMYKKTMFTDSRLNEMRLKIIKLSYAGYVFEDGYQLGVDRAGRILQFDIGGMVRVGSKEINTAFKRNNVLWIELLKDLGKQVSKIGRIEMDKKVTTVSNNKTSSSKRSSPENSKSKRSSK